MKKTLTTTRTGDFLGQEVYHALMEFPLNKEVHITMTNENIRSLKQNDRYWGKIIEAFSDLTGYDRDEVHHLLGEKFRSYEKKGKNGKVRTFIKSTTAMTTKEFAEYCDKCEEFGREYGMVFD